MIIIARSNLFSVPFFNRFRLLRWVKSIKNRITSEKYFREGLGSWNPRLGERKTISGKTAVAQIEASDTNPHTIKMVIKVIKQKGITAG